MRALVLPLSVIALWEAVGRSQLIQSDMMSKPSDIGLAGLAALTDGSMLFATSQTITTALVGLLIGSAIGISFGAWFGLSNLAGRLSLISVEAFRPVPSVALIPIAMLVFGFGFFLSLVVTRQRSLLREPWIWMGGVLAFAISLPNLIWEMNNHWPTIEILRNVDHAKNAPAGDPNSADGYGPNQDLPPLCVRFSGQFPCPT